ncbi:MAG: carboxypeptidase-like regulatory domain-containing protein, partial [Dysgonamonadaceae bacterium]|nr:carboxypeptidase-like regulatory domain-containing protein [Dysgonamonadaceae bacterium]
MKKLLKLFVIFLLFPFCSFAQSVSVSGVITDQSGEVLIGVSIVESGTANGTVSNVDGQYRITVSPNAKLTFTYIGYSVQTVEVNGRQTINVTLTENDKLLEEVVVIGYGTMKKSDLTGAVTSVRAEAIQKSVPTSIDQVLQGRAAGVQVQQNSGAPGASTSIRIRGINS